ncbi:uncharacterized protein ARB_01221 [Trichophyton benhamiae CBS 112371]|uniref:Uncharacterized protein n=1 Tax=Arthroderma benhamiae (strain ATCC MYA-4681 / CBS 112371) TaxID=663331 RepID=D4AYF2_ARTBC|nr:uncharacterized protein ARB_01221 [Trichophyton benhamiae CBS 112371]EFE31968.1 conserved hypothetical protein [Trichophyton benhamiae CBS 112371]
MGALSRLLPVILVILLVVALAAVGLVIYSIAMDVKDNTKKKMEKKNVAFSREGAKVGVKEMQAEEYQDRTQRYFPDRSLLLLFENKAMY